MRPFLKINTHFSLLALVLTPITFVHGLEERAVVSGPWGLVQQGTTGVSAMQLAITTETTAIIYDKVEHNALTVNGHVAWAAELNLNTQQVRALNPLSNSWCATGSFLGNGTLVNSGGNPVVITGANGLQAIRLFTPCTNQNCDVFEDPTHIHLTSNRWYPSSIRLEDGSVMIYGSVVVPVFLLVHKHILSSIRRASTTLHTNIFLRRISTGFNGTQIPSQFLRDTLNGNHFPVMVYLPDGTIFVAANQAAMILNWKTNTETRLPGIPNGVRIASPFSAGATLLPLTPENNFTPEVMICGGSTVSDSVNPTTLSSQTPTSAQCSRLVLNTAGIAAGWKVESMPQARVMPELVLLPDGRVLIVNGAGTGVAGYGNVANRVGQSNADNPAFTPVLYDPNAAAGSRFSTSGLPTSTIARMYHSTSSLTPNGSIVLAGSNPNDDVTTVKYATEYRLEFLSPPYLGRPRPTYTGLPATVKYGLVFNLSLVLPSTATSVNVSLMDLGFATHAVHMDQRLVRLRSTLSADKKTLTVTAPVNGALYPPGPAYLYVVTNEGVPSFGHKTIIGTGLSPPVDAGATANTLQASVHSFVEPPPPPTQGEGSFRTSVIPA
uniref:Copper radical oxidase n=1 Tax=Strobilurus tenacellus TaxID=41251 RepID=A0A384XC29_STRTC|nr:copper radical oxidase [Strobilurus tenacellus]